MPNQKEKIKVTREELGRALFMFVYKTTWDHFSDKKIVKKLSLGDKDKRHLALEATAALFYLAITTLEGSLGDENSEKKVFDSMQDAFYKGLGLDEEKTRAMKDHLVKRYAEYRDAVKEKRGPNWLWPLTHHILNNLRQEETKDFWAMNYLMAFLTSAIESFPKLISEYEIVETTELPGEQSKNSEEGNRIIDKTEEGGTYIF